MELVHPEYMQGYIDTVIAVNHALNRSIVHHKDAETPEDCVKVLSEVIGFVHLLESQLADYSEMSRKHWEEHSWFEEQLLYLAVDNTRSDVV